MLVLEITLTNSIVVITMNSSKAIIRVIVVKVIDFLISLHKVVVDIAGVEVIFFHHTNLHSNKMKAPQNKKKEDPDLLITHNKIKILNPFNQDFKSHSLPQGLAARERSLSGLMLLMRKLECS